MKDNIEMSKPIYYLIASLCALIIMASSIEALIKVKDNGLFDLWLSNPNLNIDTVGQSKEQLYSIYQSMCLSLFFIKVITPVALAINTYLAFIKLRVNKIFVRIWSILIIGLFAFTLLGESSYSIFFILSTIAYIGLVVIMIYLGKEINREISINVVERIQKT